MKCIKGEHAIKLFSKSSFIKQHLKIFKVFATVSLSSRISIAIYITFLGYKLFVKNLWQPDSTRQTAAMTLRTKRKLRIGLIYPLSFSQCSSLIILCLFVSFLISERSVSSGIKDIVKESILCFSWLERHL